MTDEERAQRIAGFRESIRHGTFSNAGAELVLSELDRVTAERDEALKTFRDCRGSEHHQEMAKERDAALAQVAKLREAAAKVAEDWPRDEGFPGGMWLGEHIAAAIRALKDGGT